MNPEASRESILVLRRVTETMPGGALLFPILFALAVVCFIVMYRKRHKLMYLGIGAGIVLVAGGFYLVLGLMFREALSWWLVLLPTLFVAFVYVGVMYFRDSHSVHFTWATFLGTLRAAVYILLGFCFLLPGCQEYETTVAYSKVLVLFDVSASMDATDTSESDAGGKTRQEKIIRFLTTAYPQGGATKTFLDHLQDNTAVACYRFGGVADEEPVVFDKHNKTWNADDWRKWLRPNKKDIVVPADLDPAKKDAWLSVKNGLYDQLRDATDVGGAALQVVQREGANRIQALILISDGNSNKGDEEAIRQLLERAGNAKRPIHILTVGVGDYKQPVRIRVNPLVTPQAVRVDDGGFEVRVPVFGDGLPGKDFNVSLYAKRIKDSTGNPVKDDNDILIETKTGRFGGGGEFPFDEVVFKVDLADVLWRQTNKDKRDPKAELDEATKQRLQGEWKFHAKVPRDPHEAANKDEPFHVTAPKSVFVNDSILRVLLFASGPSRDYQFVRTLMAREVEAKRAQLSIYLQTSKGLEDVSQDVDGSRLLGDFPNKLERPKAGGGKDGKDDVVKLGDPMNLKSYDVIIAFDANWEELKPTHMALLKEWVEGDSGGGIIFVSGPQHTQRLIPPPDKKIFDNWSLKPIYTLFPVTLKRPPPNVNPDAVHDATIPYMLNFTGIAKGFDFIKLDDDSPHPLGGWKEYFGKFMQDDLPGGIQKVHPERGFFNYYRVQAAKPGAEVIATFADPKSPKTDDGKEQPFFASLRIGKGKAFFIGNGEMWRLRTFKEEYHQRFWVKLARFVSSGGGAKSLGRFSMAGEFVTGMIQIEGEFRDKDGFPLSPEINQAAEIHKLLAGNAKDEKPIQIEMKAKKVPGKWRGTFAASVRIDQEGMYEIKTKIQGTDEWIAQTFEMRSPNVETADLRTNHAKLFNMATDAPPPMLARLDADTRARLEANKDRPQAGPDAKLDIGSGARLFFKLNTAESISQCITKMRPETQREKVGLRDLWDRGPEVFDAKTWSDLPWLLGVGFGLPFVLLTVVLILMLTAGRPLAALGVFGALVAVELGLLAVVLLVQPETLFKPSLFGVLLVVPPLVGVVAAGILLLAERYTWVLVILGATAVWMVGVFGVQLVLEPAWPAVRVDFTWVLVLIGLLLSLEWFTRKMLRLA